MNARTEPNLAAGSVLQASDTTAWQQFEEETVVLDLAGRKLIGLNDVAGRVWRLVDGQRTVDQIAEQVAAEFALPHEQVLGDVLRFANKLFVRGLVSVAPRLGL